ncbi:hypothetical protein BRARA_C01260 [Brassica rapa]|uniref:Uncharacterized protein n=1 Tax=Brassica campestris TaxID=3711 RepID=A0A397ZU52_BRACM|nr:hypothetical protein BRARA_C01260 [Brassica rapa]
MALRTARVSAMRGDETKVAFAAYCDGETRSSTIQPKPAFPVSGFHAASLHIVMARPDHQRSNQSLRFPSVGSMMP